jgi:predicted NUDIX family NTP pyrophosphohydrolase
MQKNGGKQEKWPDRSGVMMKPAVSDWRTGWFFLYDGHAVVQKKGLSGNRELCTGAGVIHMNHTCP